MANFLDKRWEIGRSVPPEVENELKDYSKIMRQLLYNREIFTAEAARQYLDKSGSLYDPFLLTDMEKVVVRLLKAIAQEERIFVYGDYDVDGVTATALLVQVLHRMGGNVKEYIPHRFEEGYGLNFEALEKVAAQEAQVVITVDCGIRSPAEVLRARELGIDLIITDHHEPTADLPEAYAIICPKRSDDEYPDKNLAGVGVTYKLVEALLERQPVAGVRAEDWLDLVAIGTVADVVPLNGENRALVKAGLALLRSGRRQGLVSLAGAAEHPLERTTARDIGFVLGPRLNAAGGLVLALESFPLLTERGAHQGGGFAQKMVDQKPRRQGLTLSM
jgi:single-stranded-DNA-specific exonuclease